MIRSTVTDRLEDQLLTCLPYAIVCYNHSVNNTHGFYELIFEHNNITLSKYMRYLNNKNFFITKQHQNKQF